MGVLGLFFALCIGVFYVKRALWVRRNRAEGRRGGRYRGGAALGNALQELQVFVQPRTEHVIVQRMEEAADEDDSAETKDPTAHLMRQAKRIRNGEHVEQLTTLLPP